MNESGLHPSHEKRRNIISTVFIRRGGAPPGATAYMVIGGMGGLNPHHSAKNDSIFTRNDISEKKHSPFINQFPVWRGSAYDATVLPIQKPFVFLCKGNAVLS